MEQLPTSLEQQFQNYETALSDPSLLHINEQAKMFAEIISSVRVSNVDELNEIVAGLDKEVRHLIGQRVEVCGRIDIMITPGIRSAAFIDDDNVSFGGYIVVETDTTESGYQLRYLIHVPMTDEQKLDAEDDKTHIAATANLDEVVLDFKQVDVKRAEAWLEMIYPELFSNLDMAFLNADGTEADALIALKGFDFSDIIDREDTEMAKRCIGIYLKSKLQIDDDVPYSCKINGDVIATDDDKEYAAAKFNDTVLIDIHDVIIHIVKAEGSSLDGVQLYVDASVINKDRRYVNLNLLVPLESVDALYSIRDAYYS